MTTIATEEYVEDFPDVRPSYDVDDTTTAASMLGDYAVKRLREIADAADGPLTLMVSGGIDSLHMLAAAVHAGIDANAVCVAYLPHPGSMAQARTMHLAARNLGFTGDVDVLLLDEVPHISQRVGGLVDVLDTDDVWEVGAGLIFHIVDQHTGRNATLVSASGADTLLCGGVDFGLATGSVGAWDELRQGTINAAFTRSRRIPDFYDRVMDGGAQRHYKLWQTHEAMALTNRLHPTAVRGAQWATDKAALRLSGLTLGLDFDDVTAAKEPMQSSSGATQLIADIAAGCEIGPDEPISDSPDYVGVAARLYLAQLAGN